MKLQPRLMRNLVKSALIVGGYAVSTAALAASPLQYGADLFQGGFASKSIQTVYPEYRLQAGDSINLSLYGAIQVSHVLKVDPSGYVVIPNVGPALVAGIQAAKLPEHLTQTIRATYNSNVSVYASLATAQPVKVSVAGEVHLPGIYEGLSSDNIIKFLDSAKGIRPTGSFRSVKVLRAGKVVAEANLYDYKKKGTIAPFYFMDGDLILVEQHMGTVSVEGTTLFEGVVEIPKTRDFTVKSLMTLVGVKPGSTQVQVTRVESGKKTSFTSDINDKNSLALALSPGDEIYVSSNITLETIPVKLKLPGNQEVVASVKNGFSLGEFLAAQNIDEEGWPRVKVYRASLAAKQKDAIDLSLRALQQATFTARSSTAEESTVKTAEAALVSQFVASAKEITPRGQVALNGFDLNKFTLEPGDVVEFANSTPVVQVSGSVLSPGAFLMDEPLTVEQALSLSGGTLQDPKDLIFAAISQGGSSKRLSIKDKLEAGDELLVVPRVSTKNFELSRAISTVLYQIAFSAKVVLGL